MISTRRRITTLRVAAAGAVGASLPTFLRAGAQDATPEAMAMANPFAELGLPEIELEVTDDGVTGLPESVEAGRYLMIVHGEPTEEQFSLGVSLLQLPEGMTMDDMMAEMEAAGDAPPELYYSAMLPGGPQIIAGTGESSAYAVVDLPPGDWLAMADTGAAMPSAFTVTGEMPADLAEPEANVTLTLSEMAIDISDGAFEAGQNVVRIENTGSQPHFVEIGQAPEGATEEEIAATLGLFMGTPPPEGVETYEDVDLPSVAMSAPQSTGTVQWVSWSLEPGSYIAMCWIPDPETMMPHAFLGMWTLFTVE